jgi:NAD(P)-dependent dehydrogenase (short-subunit alcohol dehydrogenase family)
VTRVWFVTGATSGFGEAIAREALTHGDRVVATGRRLEALRPLADGHPDRVLPMRLDVTDPGAAHTAMAEAVSALGHVDVVVNNAGYGHIGAVEELTDSELREQIDVVLFGTINITRAALPHLRRQRSGHFVQMSSLNGVEGLAGGGYYAASKFGIEGLSESLAAEVAHLGIKVTVVEPGPHRTRFANPGSTKRAQPIDDYEPSVGKTRQAIAALDGNQPGDPVRAAKAVLAAVNAPHPPFRLPLGTFAVNNICDHLAAQLKELEQWQSLSESTDFPS